MVMTSEMWHLMFEPIKETEYSYVMNEIKKSNKGNQKNDTILGKIRREENGIYAM